MTQASDDTSPADTEATASFGYREVPLAEKEPVVRQVFDNVAGRYDLMNDLMSMGVHRLWKAALVDMVAPREGQALLDVAGGTGDVAFRLQDRAPKAQISVCDINEKMLSVGRDRAIDAGRVAVAPNSSIDLTIEWSFSLSPKATLRMGVYDSTSVLLASGIRK